MFFFYPQIISIGSSFIVVRLKRNKFFARRVYSRTYPKTPIVKVT